MAGDNTKHNTVDIVKDIIFSILWLIGFAVYWVFVLGLISLALVSVWKVSWIQLLVLAGILTVISEIVHIVRLVLKRKKEKEIKDYLKE